MEDDTNRILGEDIADLKVGEVLGEGVVGIWSGEQEVHFLEGKEWDGEVGKGDLMCDLFR